MPADERAKEQSFEISAFLNEIFESVAMGYSHHVLLDDRPVVELFRDVVRSRSNQLHSSLKGLLVWLCAYKRRQKRMIDVDDALGKGARELGDRICM